MLSAELFERTESRWARLTNRHYPVSIQDALEGEGWIQSVKDLLRMSTFDEVVDLRDDETPA